MNILNDGLVGSRAWRVFERVGWALVGGILWSILAHVSLRQVVGAGAGGRWHIMLLLRSLLGANPVYRDQRGVVDQ